MRAAAVFAALLLGLLAVRSGAEDAGPFPAGTSSQKLEGLTCSIVMPPAFDPAKERSLVVILHGAGGTETGMAAALAHLAARDFVVLAPKSKAQPWDAADLEAVRKIVGDLKKRLHVGERRLHGIGFSNGGWNLAPVALDEALRFQSATWVASGFKGGKFPKHAKKEMGVLALAGGDDPNHDAAEATPKLAGDKVRSAEVRIQPGLGHAWPEKLVPYLSWWLEVQEGRFTPGVCAAFDWKGEPQDALAAASSAKSGAFVYWYSDGDAADPRAKAFQNDVLRDALVQRFGQQLAAGMGEKTALADEFAKTGIATTPAVIVYDAAGKVTTALSGKFDAKTLSAALRKVAADKSLPKD